jgi:hypothetical protein
MLEPQQYPEMVAKALVLDEEPFVNMIDDDNPWIEGLALTAAVGLLAGAAQTVGGWLTTASLPDPMALQNTLESALRQLATATNLAPEVADALAGSAWNVVSTVTGYSGGWTSVTPLVATPFLLLVWWLFFGFITYGAAHAAGGGGSLNSTLGASALMVAPQILLLFSIIPFAGVSSLLLSVWGLLIGYRAVQTTHNLTWGRAAIVTLIPYAVALLLVPVMATVFVLGLTAGGFR